MAIKTIRLKTILICLLALICNTAYSQQFHELKIDDTVPDITIRHFFNDTTKTEKISNLYKNKLLLLDFWGTWCGACLEELPTFDKVKKEFGNQIEIVAVGYEPREKIAALFNRNPSLNSPNYITLYNDTVLTRVLFPHKLLPHVVWINKNGKVVAITEGYDVTSSNITNMLNSRPVAARVKIDNADFDISAITKPFHIRDTDFLSRSIVTRRVSGAPSFEGFQGYADIGIASYNRIFIGNLTIRDMYWDVLFLYKLSAKNFSRLKIETRDSLKFFLPRDAPLSFRNSKYQSYDDWADSSLYFYDLVLPKRINDTLLRKYAVADLNRHFNLNGRYELRESECYILCPRSDRRKDPIQGTETSKIHYPKSQLEKVNVSQLTDLLNSKLNSGIIINESKMSDQKLFNLNAALKTVTINQIAAIIEPFGLTIYKGKRKIPIFIISEN